MPRRWDFPSKIRFWAKYRAPQVITLRRKKNVHVQIYRTTGSMRLELRVDFFLAATERAPIPATRATHNPGKAPTKKQKERLQIMDTDILTNISTSNLSRKLTRKHMLSRKSSRLFGIILDSKNSYGLVGVTRPATCAVANNIFFSFYSVCPCPT